MDPELQRILAEHMQTCRECFSDKEEGELGSYCEVAFDLIKNFYSGKAKWKN